MNKSQSFEEWYECLPAPWQHIVDAALNGAKAIEIDVKKDEVELSPREQFDRVFGPSLTLVLMTMQANQGLFAESLMRHTNLSQERIAKGAVKACISMLAGLGRDWAEDVVTLKLPYLDDDEDEDEDE